MAEQNNMGYPAISEKAWWIIRDKFKASLPTTFSPTYPWKNQRGGHEPHE